MAGLVMTGAGCVSPDGITPRAVLTDPASLGAVGASGASGAAGARDTSGSVPYPELDWWTAYGDARLNDLINTALAGNPTIGIAQARLARAEALAEGAGALRLPQVGAAAESSRQRLSQNYFYSPAFAGTTQLLNNATLNATWEADLFGRQRAALDAAIGTVRAASADREAARVLLAARVATVYFGLAQQLELRALAAATRDWREQLHKLVAQRVGAGLDTTVELRQAESAVPQAQLEIDLLDEQIAHQRHALAALTGAGPHAADALAPALAARTVPALPAHLPADLIGRRADIVAARWRVEAAARDIDGARAEFYPNLNLTAFIGFQSLGLARWLQAGSQVAGLGPALRLPLFDGGRLRGNLRARSADFDAAVEDYNARLIDSLRDVADQLTSSAAVEAQGRAQAAALSAAESAHALAQQRYRAGLSTYLAVLTAELALQQQRRGTVELKARRYVVDIALARALGGGFREVAPAAPPAGAPR